MNDNTFEGLRLERTCYACPEQYDVFNKDNEQVAYMRLRHGRFTVECRDCGEDYVYIAYPEGDGLFIDDHERAFHLANAIKAIKEYYESGKTVNRL